MRSSAAAAFAGVAGAALAACSDVRPRPDAGSTTVSVHPAGILDPASDDFHGKELQRLNWDFRDDGRLVTEEVAADVANPGLAEVSLTASHRTEHLRAELYASHLAASHLLPVGSR